MRQWRRALAVVLTCSGLLALALGRAAAGPTEAMQKCLKGRCEQGAPDDKKLPDYNLGWGYTCDWERVLEYRKCKAENGTTEEICLTRAAAKRDACRMEPCPFVYSQCKAWPCKKTSNDWDCWKGDKFGYWDYVDGAWVFTEVAGDQVPDETWEKVCAGQRERCKKGRAAKRGDKVAPIGRSFCSAKCYGHNCHHAAAEVCECLEKEGAGDVKVIVFDRKVEGPSSSLPCKPGNIAHSMLTLPHPTDATLRCLIESQRACADPVVDPKCCFKAGDLADFKKLKERGCPLIKMGPLKEELPFDNLQIFDECNKFLEERGTCAAELPRLSLDFALDLEDESTPECFLTCGPEGTWREVWEDTFSPCGPDAVCAPPDGMLCPDTAPEPVCLPPSPEPEPTCGPAGCGPDSEPPSVYRGMCVPKPSPTPSPSPEPTPWPSPSPTPSPTPEPTPWPSPTPTPMPTPVPVPTSSPLPLHQR